MSIEPLGERSSYSVAGTERRERMCAFLAMKDGGRDDMVDRYLLCECKVEVMRNSENEVLGGG